MMNYLYDLLSLHGVAGDEGEVREYIKKAAAPFADEMHEDVIGSLFVFKKGKQRRKKKMLLSSHMDEVGMIVREICDDGYLKFDFAGGVDTRIVLGKRVLVGKNKIPGVIGLRPIHLTTKEEREKTPKVTELTIDIGCEKKAAAEKLVSLGDYVAFDSKVVKLSENRIKGCAFDDRFGCAVSLKLLSEELEYDTWFAFTVQEEVGVRAAFSAAHSIKPDFALILEATTAGDLPDSEGADKVTKLSGGAAIGYMDCGTIYDKKLFAKLRTLAEENGIPWQMKSRVTGGTEAGTFQRANSGAHSTSLSLPTRYIHSPSCVADVRDMEAVLNLARCFINLEEDALND
ncbi:MAG: M42 family peptidase [Oscillospiraceae bacterium]|nr:M42 family peptidase [Oscillospiraceae bacterium]